MFTWSCDPRFIKKNGDLKNTDLIFSAKSSLKRPFWNRSDKFNDFGKEIAFSDFYPCPTT